MCKRADFVCCRRWFSLADRLETGSLLKWTALGHYKHGQLVNSQTDDAGNTENLPDFDAAKVVQFGKNIRDTFAQRPGNIFLRSASKKRVPC